jgi:hypothetical protein
MRGMANRLAPFTLAVVLVLQGCASTTLNGDPIPGQPTGQDIAKAVLGIALVGALVWAASEASDSGPDETYVTSCGGGTCRTEVYR